MWKLAIVLCAVLFDSTANARYWGELKNIQLEAHETIDARIVKVNKKHERVKAEADQIIRNSSHTADHFRSNIDDEVMSAIRNISSEIKMLDGQAVGVNISDCTQHFDHLNNNARDVITKANVCINERLGIDFNRSIVMIRKVFNDEFARLNKSRELVFNCSRNVIKAASAVRAMYCINDISDETIHVVAKWETKYRTCGWQLQGSEVLQIFIVI